ncbi:MAG: helix-turn-helix domain-containing protein [Candidatus Saccharimonadales bacterium]
MKENNNNEIEIWRAVYNNFHAIKNRLRKPAMACLDEKKAIQIIEMRKQKLTHKEIAAILKISKGTVQGFLAGRSYKWLKIDIPS